MCVYIYIYSVVLMYVTHTTNSYVKVTYHF